MADYTELNEAYRETAKRLWASEDLEIDGDAAVSIGDDEGAFVQAWVWVPDSEMPKHGDIPHDID